MGTAPDMNQCPYDLSVLADPATFAKGYPFEIWDWIRDHGSMARVESEDYPPFWAVTKWKDIRDIGKRGDKFHIGPRTSIESPPGTNLPGLENLLDMDPPKHGKYRKILAAQLTANYGRQSQRTGNACRNRQRGQMQFGSGEISFRRKSSGCTFEGF